MKIIGMDVVCGVAARWSRDQSCREDITNIQHILCSVIIRFTAYTKQITDCS